MLHSLASWTKFEVKVNVFNKVGEGDFSSAKNFTTMEFGKSLEMNMRGKERDT